MNRTRLVAAAWATVSLAGVAAAVATPPAGKITSNQLAFGRTNETIVIQRTDPTDFRIDLVTLEPGASTGWHSHPGAEYSIVKAGSVVVERDPWCEPTTVLAGEALFIPERTPHQARNSGREPAEVYATYTVPAGTTVLRKDEIELCTEKQEQPAATSGKKKK